MPRRASKAGLALGAAAVAVLLVGGLWLALGSFSTTCFAESSIGADPGSERPELTSGCTSADSLYRTHGVGALVALMLPALVALSALALTPLARVRAPARWAVVALLVPLALLLVFTPFMFLVLLAAGLMTASAVTASLPAQDTSAADA